MRHTGMDQPLSYYIVIIANILLIAGLIWYGLRLFAEYHATGKWAKNITGLLGGIGMLLLAVALILTPGNAQVLLRLAQTKISTLCLWMSSLLLLASIASYGVITYSKPFRLWHERRIRRDLSRDLPKIP